MSFFHSKSITAKLVGPNLVASFPNANPPLIWKFDLDRNHSFTIALQGEMGDWELGITSPKGEFYPVAHFPLKEDAEDALDKVQKVLMKKKRSLFWRIMLWVLGLASLAALLFFAWAYITLKIASPFMGRGEAGSALLGGASTSLPSAPPPPSPGTLTPGVPVPADDVLKPPN